MFIYPINVEGFYFNELSEKAQMKVIEDKITYIILNLDKDKYKKYKDTIEFVQKTNKPLDYREFLRKYNYKDIIKDILSDNRIYDFNGNIYNIIVKDNEHLLFLTKTTHIPVKILTTEKYNVYFRKETAELPTIEMISVEAPNKKLAKEFAVSKFANKSRDNYLDTIVHKAE